MATIRVSNIEAKADASSPTINEKVKITNSNGDVMLQLDGATSGITTVGINTTGNTLTIDENQNITFSGIVTASSFVGDITGNLTGNVNSLGVSTFAGPIIVDSNPFFENVQGISTDYTVLSNRNAMTIGPVGINTGVTVAIQTGGNWVIV
jgi:hypothetical protein